MINIIATIERIKKDNLGYWTERIIGQLEYACKLSEVRQGKYDAIIRTAVQFLEATVKEQGTVTKSASQTAEGMIRELSPDAKSFKMICAAHAHIDMNWMWGFPETVAITLDTFRTMLNLMNEYPDFKFSQSQASVYKIVEEYDPAMLEEIRKRVNEGRWEVTASTWVETDKNMPNGESLARHILYTKKYLKKLLGLDPDGQNIDFEPDTFGHNRNVPEILSKGGVKFYYHCRGYEGHHIYKWLSPSGKSIISYREPNWYNASIKEDMVVYIPEFCSKYGIDTALKVYGVGDHGGGPSRRDIEKLIDMSGWSVFPAIRFGTFSEFYNVLEQAAENLPVVEGELNFVFSGCYTTQTRIKEANRTAEARLNESEAFSALSALYANGNYSGERFEKAWEKVLFNHFHDIIPGSGIVDTREYAMGQFQKIMAAANTEESIALCNIASKINTSSFATGNEDLRYTESEGAGVGYAIKDYCLPQTERGRGKKRILHFFNPSAAEREEVVQVVLWDWPGEKDRIAIKDFSRTQTKHQLLDNDKNEFEKENYWGHEYIKLLAYVKVPAYGYSTYILDQEEPETIKVRFPLDQRVEKNDSYLLENELIRVEFDSRNAAIISMTDKTTGLEMVDKSRPTGIFRLIEEDDSKGMTAWVVGRYMNVIDLLKDVKIDKIISGEDLLRQWISYHIKFRSSKLEVRISLDQNSAFLDYEVICDWQEVASIGDFIPQLGFTVPMAYKGHFYRYDIPFGTIERVSLDMDVPANSWAAAVPSEGSRGIVLATRSKYGFRGVDDALSVTLIRSSYDPDPYPESGIHNIKFSLGIADLKSNIRLISEAYDYCHPISYISGTAHDGTLPAASGFISLVEGNAAISAIKLPEEDNTGKKLIIRLYETEGLNTKVRIKLAGNIVSAGFVDINEKEIPVEKKIKVDCCNDTSFIEFNMDAFSVESIILECETYRSEAANRIQ